MTQFNYYHKLHLPPTNIKPERDTRAAPKITVGRGHMLTYVHIITSSPHGYYEDNASIYS